MRFEDMTVEERRIRHEALFSIPSPEMESLRKCGEAATSAGERVQIALEMGQLCINLAIQAIHDENPEWTKNEVMVEYFRWSCFPQPLPSGAVNAILKYPYQDLPHQRPS